MSRKQGISLKQNELWMPANAPQTRRDKLFLVLLVVLRLSPLGFLSVSDDFHEERGAPNAKSEVVQAAESGMHAGGEGVDHEDGKADEGDPCCCEIMSKHRARRARKAGMRTLGNPVVCKLEWLLLDLVETRVAASFDSALQKKEKKKKSLARPRSFA